MNKFDSLAFLAALALAAAAPTFAADPGGATPPGTDSDVVIPGAKAVDEVGGGAIVDPDRVLKRDPINKGQSTKQPCKKPAATQSTNTGDAACESTDKDGQITPKQRK